MNKREIKKNVPDFLAWIYAKEARARMYEVTEVLSAYIQSDSVFPEPFSLIQQGIGLFEHGLKETLGGGGFGREKRRSYLHAATDCDRYPRIILLVVLTEKLPQFGDENPLELLELTNDCLGVFGENHDEFITTSPTHDIGRSSK